MELTANISKHNFFSFLWHGIFLAFAQNFMDVDTIMPAMLIESGGGAMHVGILTAIMLGGASITQLFFAPIISNYNYKKKFLLFGINARMSAVLGLAFLLLFSSSLRDKQVLYLIFLLISIFSIGGAFANVSYTDIFGKSVLAERRKTFFSIRQVVIGSGVFFSALLARKVLASAGYPDNYTRMFFIGFLTLSIASLGFWKIKEVVPSRLKIKSFGHFIAFFKQELRENDRLKHFLAYVNTQGIVISLMPFLLLYAKQHNDGGVNQTGQFLLFKVIGTVLAGLAIFLFRDKIKYRNILNLNVLLAIIAPVLILIFATRIPVTPFFILGGIVYSLYSISMNGVLLEVSGTENRSLYTGIAGAGNILPAIFPLLGAWIINNYGFPAFFVLFIVIVSSSLLFIYKLNCKK
ncbi:MAG: MFS transporter [Bacteroidales bacterium]|nr:MFS transporter [Bacteroidales bacterium]MCF8390806.1 MFS transporter [Bacteroidales bacterium]